MGLGTNNSNGALTVAGGIADRHRYRHHRQPGHGRARRGHARDRRHLHLHRPVNGIVIARNAGTNVNNVGARPSPRAWPPPKRSPWASTPRSPPDRPPSTVNGGTLYLGAGGIVRNGTGTFATNLNFSAGVLGAKASWATAVPITLPAGGNVTIKAADAPDLSYDITLSGPLAGPGGFAKTGPGTLALTGASTFAGPVAVAAGVLRVDGSVGAGGAVTVGSGGTLAGGGTLARAADAGGRGHLPPAAPRRVRRLRRSRSSWTGGTLAFDLGGRPVPRADRRPDPIRRGATGASAPSAPLVIGATYTLATYASTDCGRRRLLRGRPGRGPRRVPGRSLQPPVPGDRRRPDRLVHALGLCQRPARGPGRSRAGSGRRRAREPVRVRDCHDPLQTNVSGLVRHDRDRGGQDLSGGDVLSAVRTWAESPPRSGPRRLDFASLLGTEEVSATPRGDGTEDVVVRSAVPLARAAEPVLPPGGDAAGE